MQKSQLSCMQINNIQNHKVKALKVTMVKNPVPRSAAHDLLLSIFPLRYSSSCSSFMYGHLLCICLPSFAHKQLLALKL